MTIPSQYEYETREAADLQRQLREVEKAPLADRKEAAGELLNALRTHPETVAERIGWLLDGNYGYGSYKAAERIFGSPRMNRQAALFSLVAALEWQTPARMAFDAWKKLTADQKARLERAIKAQFASHERYLKENAGASRDPRRARAKATRAKKASATRRRNTLRTPARYR